MHANSRAVSSNQDGIHDQLDALVSRHASTQFQKPVAAVNRSAFDDAVGAWRAAGSPALILDAGCGVGLSTLKLARAFPQAFIIGVDQSADRLGRQLAWPDRLPQNQIRVRADLVDFWRLLLEAGIHPERHYLLYPNPWPKKAHIGRRWHGHAVFPVIVALGGLIECRSNWRIYVEEFAAALQQLSGEKVDCQPYLDIASEQTTMVLPDALTPFEEKYRRSGHALWRCSLQLPSPGKTRISMPINDSVIP